MTENTDKIIVIIGLGNFPKEYTFTRHNIGKDFLEWLYKNNFQETKSYLSGSIEIEKENCLCIIPKTFMNNAGDIFLEQKLQNIYKNSYVKKTIIVHDDLDVPFGKSKIRVNKERSARGHNGNRSILEWIKKITKEKYEIPYFLSIGVGRPDNESVSSWVLKKYTKNEVLYLENNIFPKAKIILRSFFEKS